MRLAMFGVLALACAAPVSAKIVVTTFTGTIADIQGTLGPLNPFGAIIPGHAYTLTYSADDGAPNAHVQGLAYGNRLSGSGSVTAELTINGVTRAIGGQTSSVAEHRTGEPITGQLYDSVTLLSRGFPHPSGTGLYADSYASTYVSSYLSHFLADGDYATPFTYTPVSTDGYFNLVHYNYYDFDTNTQLINIYLSLAPGLITSQVLGGTGTGAVPEPLAWTMMIAGFGLIGGAMRHRRHAANASFA